MFGSDYRECENNGLTCRPKNVVHTATCLEFKDGGADEKDVLGVLSYIGERSRTFRQRVEENMKALNRQDPKLFQLVY